MLEVQKRGFSLKATHSTDKQGLVNRSDKDCGAVLIEDVLLISLITLILIVVISALSSQVARSFATVATANDQLGYDHLQPVCFGCTGGKMSPDRNSPEATTRPPIKQAKPVPLLPKPGFGG